MVVYRFWIDFGSKNLSKIGGLRVVISTSLRICEKQYFKRPSIVFAIFSSLEASMFDLKTDIFQLFFEGAFEMNLLLILAWILVQMGGQTGTKIDTKSTLERMPKQA